MGFEETETKGGEKQRDACFKNGSIHHHFSCFDPIQTAAIGKYKMFIPILPLVTHNLDYKVLADVCSYTFK